MMTYDTGATAVYDWSSDKVLDERDDLGESIKCIGISSNKVKRDDKFLATGNENGEITLLKRK